MGSRVFVTGGTFDADRDRKLFFCQLEAAETAIYVAEVATRYG